MSKACAEICFKSKLTYENPKVALDPIIGFRIIEHDNQGNRSVWAESLISIIKIMEYKKYEIKIAKTDESSAIIHVEANRSLNEEERMLLGSRDFLKPIEADLNLPNFLKIQMTLSQEGITEIRQFYEWGRFIGSWTQPLITVST